MNILILSQFFSTTRGGGEHVFSLIAKNLANNGHKVWVITNRIVDENYENHKNIELIFVKPDLKYEGGLPPSFLDNIRYFINSIVVGLKLIKSKKIDIIHSNNFSPAISGSMLSYFTSIPHITSIWDIFSLCGKNYWSEWAKQTGISKMHAIIGPYFEKLILKLPHVAIHTISEASKDDLIKFGAKKSIYMIPPSIQSNPLQGFSSNARQFVYVGRLVFYKNVEVVLKAIKIVKEVEPDIKLIIVGSGPHKKNLEELTIMLGLEDNVEFRGYVSLNEKSELIAKSNALVFPSLCEGFGLVILEAFDQSRPALVSDIRPLSDIVTDKKNGFVLDPQNENQWADYLLQIIRNPQEASTMGNNGHHTLMRSYNEEAMYQKIIEMYSNFAVKNRN